ncbi:MAG: 4-hydroxythreonine-4-phosphate dehydrogenase PdxA, partial [Acidobacteriota bacterium]
AGIGPEILLRLLDPRRRRSFRPLLVLERSALEAAKGFLGDLPWQRIHVFERHQLEAALRVQGDDVAVIDPAGSGRRVTPGQPGAGDAAGALAALDLGIDLVHGDNAVGDALVTAPLSKAEISNHVTPGFLGHTDYLAEKAGLSRYGRDYLMGFLAPGLRVALLSTHVPLRRALDLVTESNVLDALRCLARHGGAGGDAGPITVAGLNPHAGEGGLLGTEDDDFVRPAVETARREGIDARGPASADSLFSNVRGEDSGWVLALYHDQGLIAVKTAAFGEATNWTLGLPYLRTSVDHGTAYDIAGRGVARIDSLEAVVASTLELIRRRTTPPTPDFR